MKAELTVSLRHETIIGRMIEWVQAPLASLRAVEGRAEFFKFEKYKEES